MPRNAAKQLDPRIKRKKMERRSQANQPLPVFALLTGDDQIITHTAEADRPMRNSISNQHNADA
jgi:hypothetical protein